MDFVKLYKGFWTGSMRVEAPYTKLVFIAMLSMADSVGHVEAGEDFIAAFCNLPLDDVNNALSILSSPDPLSTSVNNDGRRIVKDGNNRWTIVNWLTYLEMNLSQERRDYLAEKKRESRARAKESATGQHVSTNVNMSTVKEKKRKEQNNNPPTPLKVGFVKPSESECKDYAQTIGLPTSEGESFYNYHCSKGEKWMVGKTPMKDWKAAMRTWKGNYVKGGGRLQQPAVTLDEARRAANNG